MLPARCSTITRPAARARRNAPVTLMSMVLLPGLVVKFVEHAADPIDATGVHQPVEPAPGGHRQLHRGLAGGGVGDVERGCARLAADALCASRPAMRSSISAISSLAPRCCEGFRQGRAETAGAARHKDDAAFEVEQRVGHRSDHARAAAGGRCGAGPRCINSRASSGVATSRPSSFTMRTARSTSCALLTANTPWLK